MLYIIKSFFHKIRLLKWRLDSMITIAFLNMRGIKHQRIETRGIPQVLGDVTFGDNVIFNNTIFMPVGGCNRCVICAFPGGKITIGDAVGMSHVTILAKNRVSIGHKCMLGGVFVCMTLTFIVWTGAYVVPQMILDWRLPNL